MLEISPILKKLTSPFGRVILPTVTLSMVSKQSSIDEDKLIEQIKALIDDL